MISGFFREASSTLLHTVSDHTLTTQIMKFSVFDYLDYLSLGFAGTVRGTFLDIHCMYSMDQILAAFGYWSEDKAPNFREGVKSEEIFEKRRRVYEAIKDSESHDGIFYRKEAWRIRPTI
ncbi:hypothetical protein J2T13_005265 [Paenibacillus sp. DS2015]|uniref:hypothetical protein n=1 Tax=Paenibacillus sp. DS2015 TaxID=3373917 RepID=UPI003D1A39F9